MSPPSGNRTLRRWPLLLAVGLGLAAGWVLWQAEPEARRAIDRGLGLIRAAGPVPFFAAMALVPLPLAWFTIPAGEAFAAQLSLGGVIAAAAAAVAVQQALAYWVARFGLRPWVERAVRRYGYTVPRVTRENARSVALLVRLTPGPPMILGSCVLALAEVPFRLYLIVSWLVALPWVLAGVILGRGILNGNFSLAAGGVGLLAAAMIAARLLRRWSARRATS